MGLWDHYFSGEKFNDIGEGVVVGNNWWHLYRSL